MKIAKIHRYFDAEGNYSGPPDYKIKVGGEEHDIFDYADKHGIKLPKHKKAINIDIEDQHEDLEQSLDSGDIEVDGDGDSEG